MTYLDRFELVAQIGDGGFARVFKAREKATGRLVALKVLKERYKADREIVERFRREAFAVASIQSPHVVGLADFGITEGELYIAMEYAEGTTLREVIYDRQFTPAEIHVIVGQIAQALHAAHRKKVVHRDLKPENVMLVPGAGGTRVVKVLDFGLAKLAELERKLGLEPLTRAGTCFGTPQYMAPELVTGQPFDKSVDLYALAVITFEMVAGYLPWDGEDMRQVLVSVVKDPAPRLRPNHPTISRVAEVDRFLQRALSKNRRERPADAAAFFVALERALFAERPPERGTPAREDRAFATVWSAGVEIKPDGDATVVDPRAGQFGDAVEPTRGGKRRVLHSGWNPTTDPGVGLPPTLASSGFASAEHTEMVRPDHGGRGWAWLLVLALAILAVAAGIYVGKLD